MYAIDCNRTLDLTAPKRYPQSVTFGIISLAEFRKLLGDFGLEWQTESRDGAVIKRVKLDYLSYTAWYIAFVDFYVHGMLKTSTSLLTGFRTHHL